MMTQQFQRPKQEVMDWLEKKREEWKAQIYPELDSFAEVFTIQKGVYGILLESADGHGYVWLYLIKGSQRALLIDTGFGLGNLRALVLKLAEGLPVIVCNTQAHFCRSSGNYQFDTVYCHSYAAPALEALKNPATWDRLFDADGNGIWVVSKKEDVIPYQDYQVVGCREGYRFRLGDEHEVEMIWTPGSAQGGIGLLDCKNRILFASTLVMGMIPIGVAPRVQKELYKEYACVASLKKGMETLKERSKEYDRILAGGDIAELPKDIVDDLLAGSSEILDNPEEYDERLVHNDDHTVGVELFLKQTRYAKLAYNRWSIWGR